MTKYTMSLAELLAGHADDLGAAGDILVRGLAIDSREVRAGDAFVALEGMRAHGITFAPMALARGAVAVLAERPELAAASAPAVLGDAAEGHTVFASPAERRANRAVRCREVAPAPH